MRTLKAEEAGVPAVLNNQGDDKSRAAFSCDGEESCGVEGSDPNGLRYPPGSVAETILRRLQGSPGG